MAKEKNLTAVTSVAAADFLRVVTSAGASVKATFANVAKYIVETYNGSTVAGSAQSVKSALDSLNSNKYIISNTGLITLSSNEDFSPFEGVISSLDGFQGKIFEVQSSNVILDGTQLQGGRWMCVGLRHSSTDYAAFLLWSWGDTAPHFIKKSQGAWTHRKLALS